MLMNHSRPPAFVGYISIIPNLSNFLFVGNKDGDFVKYIVRRTNIAARMRAHVIIIMLLLLTVFFASTYQINLLG